MASESSMALGSMWEFWRFNWWFGLRNVVKGLDYVRCLEYPLVSQHLNLTDGGQLLDVGSGHSIFPLFLAANASVKVVALDHSGSVRWQLEMGRRLMRKGLLGHNRFEVVIGDARAVCFPDDHFDHITSISAIEHIEGD